LGNKVEIRSAKSEGKRKLEVLAARVGIFGKLLCRMMRDGDKHVGAIPTCAKQRASGTGSLAFFSA
jgi:hypothetical protein